MSLYHEDIKETVEEHEGVLGIETYTEGMRNEETGISVEVDSIERLKEIEEVLEESEVSFTLNSIVGAFTLSKEND